MTHCSLISLRRSQNAARLKSCPFTRIAGVSAIVDVKYWSNVCVVEEADIGAVKKPVKTRSVHCVKDVRGIRMR